MSDLYIGAYWGPRKESSEQCADRLATCLKELASVSDVFSSWFEKGRSRRDALTHPIQQDGILALVKSGSNKRDSDKSAIEDLGFRVGLWNGASEEHSVSLSVTCGSYSQVAGLGNSVVLNFPENLGTLTKREQASEVLASIARAWEPQWAGIISRASRNARPFTPGAPFVDWMIYLSELGSAPSKLPASASVVSVDDLGIIIITQEYPIDANDQSHVQNVQAVEAAIPV